jgi:hypothetical protein
VEALLLLHRPGVVAQQVRRLLHLAHRLEPVLADFERHPRRPLELVGGDLLRRAPHDRHALQPRARHAGNAASAA